MLDTADVEIGNMDYPALASLRERIDQAARPAAEGPGGGLSHGEQ